MYGWRGVMSVAAIGLLAVATACGGGTSDGVARGRTSSAAASSGGGAAPRADRWLAYQAMAGGHDGIFLTRVDGSHQHQILTELPGEQIHPAWSPDGTELAFVDARGDSAEVWTAQADGSRPTRASACTGSCLSYDFAAWLPTGRSLLMMRYDGPALPGTPVPSSSTLELLDLDTGTRRDVVKSAPRELFSAPRVSPDGRSYCVTVEIGDLGNNPLPGAAIAVGSISGGPARTLTKPGEFGAYCDWRPTGDEVLFTTYDLGLFGDLVHASNLYTMSGDGSGLRQLTHFVAGTVRATQPRWKPDGSAILITRVDGDGSYAHRQMAVIGPDGAELGWATGDQPLVGTHPTLQP
jgi:Tol biopolymer transport system component